MKTSAILTPLMFFCFVLLTAQAKAQTKKTNSSTSKNKTVGKPVAAATKAPAGNTVPPAAVKDSIKANKPATAEATVTAAPEQNAVARSSTAGAGNNATTSTASNHTPAVTMAPAAPVYQNPFRKGTVSTVLRQNIDYAYLNNKPYPGHTSDFGLVGGINYFFLNNFAAGIDVRYDKFSQTSSSSSTYYYYAGYLSLLYGRNILPRLSAYAKISAGLGHSKSKSTNSELPADYTDISGTIGFPVAMLPNSPLFLTPYATYAHNKTKAGIHDINEKGFTFGIKLEAYLNNNAAVTAKAPQSKWPQKGSSFIEFTTGTSYGFSTRKEYQGTIRFGDVKKTNGIFAVGYHYYFLDFLAAGLNISFSKISADNGSPDYQKKWSVQPTVTVNPPVDNNLRNLFLQVGFAFEKANYTGSKQSNTYLPLRLGYNLFAGKYISFTPKIGYQLNHSNHHNPGGDLKYTDSGFACEFGTRAWLNPILFGKK